MAINLQQLFDVKVKKHGQDIGGRFDVLFIEGVNLVQADLYAMGCDDSEVTTYVESPTETFSLPNYLYPAFSHGVDYHISTDSAVSVVDPDIAERRYEKAKVEGFNAWLRDSAEGNMKGKLGDLTD